MIVYALSFGVFVLALAGLSVGVLAGRGGIRGTCGGLNNPEGCGACGRTAEAQGPCPKRRRSA
jgi:hypothetical protein